LNNDLFHLRLSSFCYSFAYIFHHLITSVIYFPHYLSLLFSTPTPSYLIFFLLFLHLYKYLAHQADTAGVFIGAFLVPNSDDVDSKVSILITTLSLSSFSLSLLSFLPLSLLFNHLSSSFLFPSSFPFFFGVFFYCPFLLPRCTSTLLSLVFLLFMSTLSHIILAHHRRLYPISLSSSMN
jgi:hypothetical protein